MADTEKDTIPGWSGFNALSSISEIPVARVRYLPLLRAPPSDLTTIYTALLKLVTICQKLCQPHILVTADLALYSKAQQILWSRPALLDGKVTMQLGGMHLLMAFIAAIGKLFGDGGLRQLLTVSDVYAEGTARQMLEGKQLSRAVRGLKLVLEATLQLYLEAAEKWANENGQGWLQLNEAQKVVDLQNTIKVKDSQGSHTITTDLNLSEVDDTLAEFCKTGRSMSSTFAFWESFIQATLVMLRLIRAEREANFSLHLDAVAESVPYFIVGGRSNYAKYVPVYISEMRQLESKQPEAFRHLQSGGFVVRRSARSKFNSVSTDQALEQTINRDAKSEGGVSGFTLQKGALLRWMTTRHITGEYSQAVKSLHSSEQVTEHHPELGTRQSRDSNDVAKIKDSIITHFQNPFDLEEVPSDLINIVTGQVASTEVQESLRHLEETGVTKMKSFIQTRLVEGTKTKSFWDPQPSQKIATFTDMKISLASDKEKKLMIDSEVLFRRLLAVSRNRDIDLRLILSHELAAIVPSLFHDDGSMRKTNKAQLAKKLESTSSEIYELPNHQDSTGKTAYIIDGMAMLQSLNDSLFNTFDDLGKLILKRLKHIFHNIDQNICVITVVFDRYDNEMSIKNMERQRRGGSGSVAYQVSGKRNVPNYRLFLKSEANKAALAEFVSEYLVSNSAEMLQDGKSVILSGGFANPEMVKLVRGSAVSIVRQLFSTQEEADTRMVLHATHLAKSHVRTVIRCDDTDVMVILLYYYAMGQLSPEVYMHAGHAGKIISRERYVPIHTISQHIGTEVSRCLPAVHALTGCDTTSALFKIGKQTAYTKLIKHEETLRGLAALGDLSSDDTLVLENARRYALLLYGKKGQSCSTLDELRYILASTTDMSACALPPTEDAFRQHVLRAQCQAAI